MQNSKFKYLLFCIENYSLQDLFVCFLFLNRLVRFKKTNKRNLMSFFESQFEEEEAEELLNRLSKHSYFNFVSLCQMYETLTYLKENFPKKVIFRHIYAILYPR